jgi:hypothetical protein
LQDCLDVAFGEHGDGHERVAPTVAEKSSEAFADDRLGSVRAEQHFAIFMRRNRMVPVDHGSGRFWVITVELTATRQKRDDVAAVELGA